MGYYKNKTKHFNSVRTKTQFTEIQGGFLRKLVKLRSFKEFPEEGKNSRSFKECVNREFGLQIHNLSALFYFLFSSILSYSTLISLKKSKLLSSGEYLTVSSLHGKGFELTVYTL